MSSLSATQADGYYNPPDWDPQRHGPRNKFQGSSGASQFARSGTVRFELMFKSVCLGAGCGRTLDKGTRFNAKKSKVGMYFSSPIFEFALKCPGCDEPIVVRTDPEHATYTLERGARKLLADSSVVFAEGAKGTRSHRTESERAERAEREVDGDDVLCKLERRRDKRDEEHRRETGLERLRRKSNDRGKDDFVMNQVLRARNRARRKTERANLAKGHSLGLPFALLSETDEERAAVVVPTPPETTTKRRRLHRLARDPFLDAGSAEAPAPSPSMLADGIGIGLGLVVVARKRRKKQKKRAKEVK